MSKIKLSAEEKKYLDSFDSDELVSDLSEKRIKALKKAAIDTLKKDKRINIRISSRDLAALQRRAMHEGLPYQTLVSSILHKYVSGGFKDLMTNKSNHDGTQ